MLVNRIPNCKIFVSVLFLKQRTQIKMADVNTVIMDNGSGFIYTIRR